MFVERRVFDDTLQKQGSICRKKERKNVNAFKIAFKNSEYKKTSTDGFENLPYCFCSAFVIFFGGGRHGLGYGIP